MIKFRFKRLNLSLNTRTTSILIDPNVVPADKITNHIVFVCKPYYIDCLITEVSIDNLLYNPTYTPMTLRKEEILDKHRPVLCSFGISTKDEELDFPSLYWMHQLHKCPYKQLYITGSAKYSTKPLTKSLTYILLAVKIELLLHWLLNGQYESDVDSENNKDMYSQGPSSHAIALKHLTLLPFTQLFPRSKLKDNFFFFFIYYYFFFRSNVFH